VPTAPDQPRPRRLALFVTDTEWRAIRIAAAAHDTSIQGYATDTVLRRLHGEDATSLKTARRS
jgi:hypothetical protein